MAHEIQSSNNLALRQAAWHRLGIVYDKHLDRETINRHLGWTAEKHQLEYNGLPVDAYGLFRSDNGQFICSTSQSYAIHDHSILFDTIDALIMASQTDASYESAGALRRGEVVWGQADLKTSIKVRDDEHKAYLTGITSYDGSMPTIFYTCDERIVCRNTMRMSLSEKTRSKFRVKHTRNSVARLEEATEALKLWNGDLKSIEERMNFLADRMFTLEHMKGLLNHLFPPKDDENSRRQGIVDQIIENYERNDGDVFKWARGTCYNALNAITEYVDHHRGTRRKPGVSEGISRAESAMFGSGNDLKLKTYEIVTAYAEREGKHANNRTQYFTAPSVAIETPVLDSILAES